MMRTDAGLFPFFSSEAHNEGKGGAGGGSMSIWSIIVSPEGVHPVPVSACCQSCGTVSAVL